MNLDLSTLIPILIPLLLQLTGLTFAVIADPYISRKSRNILLINVTLALVLTFQNVLEYCLDWDGTKPYARTIAAIAGYTIRPIILVMFIYIVKNEEDKARPAWILIGINTAIQMTALFSGLAFRIDENNHFQRGPLGYTCHIVSAILILQLFILTIRRYRHLRSFRVWIPVYNVLLITLSVIVDTFVDGRVHIITFLTIAVVSSSLFYYIWLHLQMAREYEQDLQTEQRIQIMMTQIQPHFLFNTISTIKALCRRNPEMAAEIAGKFGSYLRQNLDSLDVTGLIPFRKELEHTMLYSDIEMVRFDNVKVEYHILDDDFSIPPLTLQPIVENAIRHGVRIREEGTVLVRTERGEDMYEIIIEDNGLGFDPDSVETSEGNHIGIRNVKERIESMCGGRLSIDSRIGTGTKVTISLPDEPEINRSDKE